MEPNLSAGLESKKASVYGRDYEKDLDAYFNDVSLMQALALFRHYKYIQNAKHLADISKITETEAMDKLECLKNLSLLGVNENGYFSKTNYNAQVPNTDKRVRAKQHSIRLMQMASLYLEAERFSDDFLVFSTSEELFREFYEKVAEAKNEFIAKSNKLSPEKQKQILTFGLGFVVDDIQDTGGLKND